MDMISLQFLFARNEEDIKNVRKVLDENGGKDIQIITKIENVEGLSNLEKNSRPS